MLLSLFAKGSLVAVTFAGAVIGSRVIAKNSGRSSGIAEGGGTSLSNNDSLEPQDNKQPDNPSLNTKPNTADREVTKLQNSNSIQQTKKDPVKREGSSPQPKLGQKAKAPSKPKQEKTPKAPKAKVQAQRRDLQLKQTQIPVQPPVVKPTPTVEEIKQEATEAFNKLTDYTFKLSSPCTQGAAFILDYQVTEGNEKYPTVFYFATTTDVIKNWMFKSNEYGQKLPITVDQYKRAEERGRHLNNKENTIKNLLNGDRIVSCITSTQNGLFDIAINHEYGKAQLEGLFHSKKIKGLKLFYSGVDFWKNKDASNKTTGHKFNYKDFVVIEVEFSNYEDARTVTRGFADYYNKDNKKSPINVFSYPLSISKVDANEDNYYSLAYKDKQLTATKNWKEGDLTSSVLSKTYPQTHMGHKGYIPQDKALWSKAGLRWNNENTTYWESGYFYLTEGNSLGAGSSGSIAIDKHGNLLGIKNGQEEAGYSLYTPLRSEEISNGRIHTPKYDLILGADGQNGSYKEQVDKYIIGDKKRATWLSTFDAWNKPSVAVS